MYFARFRVRGKLIRKSLKTDRISSSLNYDIEDAKRVGITTAWITSAPHQHESVDYVLPSLKEIETHAA